MRATFFVLGQMVEEHPDLVRRMVLEGHEVANHSWSHQDLTGLSAGRRPVADPADAAGRQERRRGSSRR